MVIITAISLLRNKWCRILMFYFHFCSPPSILSTHYVLKITEEGVLKWHNSVLLLPLIWSVFYLESERNHTKVNCSISIFILSLNIVHFFFSFMSMLVLFPPHFYLSQHWQKKMWKSSFVFLVQRLSATKTFVSLCSSSLCCIFI